MHGLLLVATLLLGQQPTRDDFNVIPGRTVRPPVLAVPVPVYDEVKPAVARPQAKAATPPAVRTYTAPVVVRPPAAVAPAPAPAYAVPAPSYTPPVTMAPSYSMPATPMVSGGYVGGGMSQSFFGGSFAAQCTTTR